MPKAINFAEAFAKADFLSNMTVYFTVIIVTAVFILLAVYAHKEDRRDDEKVGICAMPDNRPGDSYYYEMIVFTGSRENSRTDSRVRFILSGDECDTGVRHMYDRNRKAFRTGGVDSFVLATEK